MLESVLRSEASITCINIGTIGSEEDVGDNVFNVKEGFEELILGWDHRKVWLKPVGLDQSNYFSWKAIK